MNFEKFEAVLMKVIGPVATAVNNNKTLGAIAEGFMRTIPITLGLALFAIAGSLPIPGWSDWIAGNGIKNSLDAALGASTNVLSLYIAFSIAYCYAKRVKENAITAGFLSLAAFVVLMPQTLEGSEGVVKALSISYLSADGMLVALLTAIVTTHLYCSLTKKGIVLKMPDSVPPNVSSSLSPVFVSMIIFGIVVGTRIAFSFTPYGDIFEFVKTMISIPLLKAGATLPVLLTIFFVANTVWFFGIHPNTIQGPAAPLNMMIILSCIDAYQLGEPLPYLSFLVAGLCISIGGNGNTLGLAFAMFTAKSKRYKSMLKLSLIPNFFQVNEPLIFGMPLMLNPIFFIPMTCSCIVMGLIGYFGCQLFTFSYNPLMGLLPWTTPVFLKAFLAGGLPVLAIVLVAFLANILLYLPFFKIADRQALAEEMALAEATKEIE